MKKVIEVFRKNGAEEIKEAKTAEEVGRALESQEIGLCGAGQDQNSLCSRRCDGSHVKGG